jgi:hypothetical protein
MSDEDVAALVVDNGSGMCKVSTFLFSPPFSRCDASLWPASEMDL